MTRRTAVRTASVLLAAILVLGACGDDKDSAEAGSSGEKCEFTTVEGSEAAATDQKPTIKIPDCAVPTDLVTKDLVVGTGAEAQSGQQVTMQYVGVAVSTKEQFDASWDRGTPFGPFPLGAGKVIKGWDQGIVGMKVGGRRELVIPPALGYGAEGYPPVIVGDETLVFVVDLIAVS